MKEPKRQYKRVVMEIVDNCYDCPHFDYDDDFCYRIKDKAKPPILTEHTVGIDERCTLPKHKE